MSEPQAIAAVEPVLLKGKKDRHNGILVDAESFPETKEGFGSALVASIREWKNNGTRGVWLKIPIEKSDFISLAVAQGFIYHHAQKDYIMLTSWLKNIEEDPNKLPNYATHYLGVGGVVVKYVDDKPMILCVKERWLQSIWPDFWKVPGGAVDPGEDIATAVKREIFEETGIQTEFESLLCFRQLSQYNFGLSDIYIICKLRPLSFEIKHDPVEIFESQWIPLETFMACQDKFPILEEMAKIVHDSIVQKDYPGMEMRPVANGFRPGDSLLFSYKPVHKL
eukprot:TRINITY_DN4111_c0_g1_i1.p1 TRINITY_DN4111_c0_g1~~TRINITY_DN4111_c0_g1_i1.p1  ORF type:complete len:280 (-),score=49.56 TRINITY_DN4111_c0_g1_i1:100-939(-)